MTVEGYVSSKVNTVSQDGRSWSYYQISLVDDRQYVVGNVLKIQNSVTPTYYQAKKSIYTDSKKNRFLLLKKVAEDLLVNVFY